jgi:hypothetical protein
MRKVSSDLADGGEYAEGFGLSTLIGAICVNYLSNKIVRLLNKWAITTDRTGPSEWEIPTDFISIVICILVMMMTVNS